MKQSPTTKEKTLVHEAAGPLYTAVKSAFGSKHISKYMLANNRRRQVWHFWLTAHQTDRLSLAGQHLLHTKSKVLLSEALESYGFSKECHGLLLVSPT